jgi:hypothetical protein
LSPGIPLVEIKRDELRIAIHPERQLREIVRADREPVEMLGEGVELDHVVRDLAHDVLTPYGVSARYNSPSDAFLPPTSGTSSTPIVLNQRMKREALAMARIPLGMASRAGIVQNQRFHFLRAHESIAPRLRATLGMKLPTIPRILGYPCPNSTVLTQRALKPQPWMSMPTQP